MRRFRFLKTVDENSDEVRLEFFVPDRLPIRLIFPLDMSPVDIAPFLRAFADWLESARSHG